jgi:hypothetical protein
MIWQRVWQSFLITKLKIAKIKKLVDEIMEKSSKVLDNVQFALSKSISIDGKRKSVYHVDNKEFKEVLILKAYADFLNSLCCSNPRLYVIEEKEKEAYFMWFEAGKLIAIC